MWQYTDRIVESRENCLICLFVGERVYPSTRLDGITYDDMSVQTTDTDDSLPHSISLPLIEEPESGLETSETSGK